MVRTAAQAASQMDEMRARQRPPPAPSVQAQLFALMGADEPLPVRVQTEFLFSSPERPAPLEVRTSIARPLTPLQKLMKLASKTPSPFALTKGPAVPAKPAEGARRRTGASLRRRCRFACHRAGCCAQLANGHAWFRAGLGSLGGSGTGTLSDGLTTKDAIKQAISAMKDRRPHDETAVMPPPAGTCLRTMERKPGRLHSTSQKVPQLVE